MKVLVTGAGGFIGSKLALKLAESGNQVRALIHSKENDSLNHPNIEVIRGNILIKKSLEQAVNGCENIFHAAALASHWVPDPQLFYHVNVGGTENIIVSAKTSGIKKIVVTSTAGTMGPSMKGLPITENITTPAKLFSDYERSKYEMEQRLISHVNNGMDIVIVNPTRIFGPGELSKSNIVTRIIYAYLKGNWWFRIGSGRQMANYAFVDDVTNGHILAMESGRTGERYLIGGDNVSFNEFLLALKEVSGVDKKLISLPVWLMCLFGKTEDFFSGIMNFEPRITYNFAKKIAADWTTSIEKAKTELGYRVTPFREAVRKTVEWLMNK